MIWLAAILGITLAASLAFLLLWMRARRDLAAAQERRAAKEEPELKALLETLPVAAFLWRPDAGEAVEGFAFASMAGAKSYADFLGRLSPEDARRIEAERQSLTAENTAFSAMASAGGALYAVEGRRMGMGATVLWLRDADAPPKAEPETTNPAADPPVSASTSGASTASADQPKDKTAPLRELFAALPFPIWWRNCDLRISDCNPAYAAALDASRENVLAESRELATIGAQESALRLARKAPQSERRHLVIAGSRRLLEINEIPLPEGGTIGFAIDRTDLETAESELARHISAHGEVLENIHAAVAIYAPDRRLKFFNSAYAALWGLEEEWLRTEPLQDEILERLRERRHIPEVADFRAHKRHLSELFTSLIEPQEELLHLPDERTLRLFISPHPFGGLTFVFEDVTDRLALERSYNTLTEVQRATLDHLFEGISVYGSDGRLKLYNPAYQRIWGLSAEDVSNEPHIAEIVEKSRAYLDDGTGWEATKRDFIERVTAGTPASGRLDRVDGSVLQVASVPLPDGNVLLTSLDVTDTARVERALRERNEALETAGRLKSEFIANVSYELRTPLTAISGFAEILTNQYFGPLSNRQLEYSRGILESAQRLTTLINDILDLATIEAGYMALDVAGIEVPEMLEAVVALSRERARDRELQLECQYPSDIGRIEGDEKRLKQALFNLVSNAIKFTPPGGKVTVSAERTASDLLLTVSDTGKGIAQADQTRIFEKFERGDPKDRQSGPGLGLSLVKSIMELHGGSVVLDSAPERGTRVVCRLPLAQQNLSAAA